MNNPRVYADFHNADAQGRLRLNNVGTTDDLARQGIELREGLHLNLYADDLDENGLVDELVVDGVVAFSLEEQCWVAMIDWNAVRHSSNAHRDNQALAPSKSNVTNSGC